MKVADSAVSTVGPIIVCSRNIILTLTLFVAISIWVFLWYGEDSVRKSFL